VIQCDRLCTVEPHQDDLIRLDPLDDRADIRIVAPETAGVRQLLGSRQFLLLRAEREEVQLDGIACHEAVERLAVCVPSRGGWGALAGIGRDAYVRPDFDLTA